MFFSPILQWNAGEISRQRSKSKNTKTYFLSKRISLMGSVTLGKDFRCRASLESRKEIKCELVKVTEKVQALPKISLIRQFYMNKK